MDIPDSRSRTELGRFPGRRSERFQREHALPRHGRGESVLIRMRSRCRHLQDHGRRQQLDEARRHLREQRHVRVRLARY
jgi:hypothetical protein